MPRCAGEAFPEGARGGSMPGWAPTAKSVASSRRSSPTWCGSTPLAERLDPEELKLVLQEAVTRVIAAVEAFGGTVKDLAGDGVLALFGAPVAHEDDPERAVRAGLRIVEDITRYGREVEQAWGIEGFSVRVGVNTGLVVVGDGGFSHAPFDEVIERARQERSDRGRLELFHEADRMVVAERVACIPLVYARSMAVVTPRVHGGWEFGKTSANFADLWVETEGAERPRSPLG